MQDAGLKIKIFHLPGTWSTWWRGSFPCPVPPYGMGVITAALRQNRYFVEQEDLLANMGLSRKNWRGNPEILMHRKYANLCLSTGIKECRLNLLAKEILGTASYNGFNVIGFSVLSYPQFLFALLLAEKIKQETKSLIVFGGAFITLQGKEFFYKYAFIDYMILGDGETPFLKLLDFLKGEADINEVPGLLYRDNTGAVHANSREFYDIENMPLPDFDGLELEGYKVRGQEPKLKKEIILPYQISRGCAHRCSFCAKQGFHKISIKSSKKVIRELKEYKERYQTNYFDFCDWTINLSYEHMDRLCDLFLKEIPDINWYGWARIDCLDDRLLKKMKRAGCIGLRFGIESGSDKILQLMKKDVASEQAAETLRLAYEAGIETYISLIVGFPHETDSDVEQTIKFIEKNSKYVTEIVSLNTFLLESFSPMYNNPNEFKIENLRVCNRAEHRNYFIFDEIGGLKWRQKEKQQKKDYRRVLKALYYNILSKHPSYNIFPNCLISRRVPFLAWAFYTKNKYGSLLKIFRSGKIKALFNFFLIKDND